MTYLSQALVPRTEALHAGCVDGYAWHRAIWEAFSDRPDADRDFLFRVDPDGSSFRVLLLSVHKPAALLWMTWLTKVVAPAFLDHATYRFQLRANPTMRRSSDGRRLGIYTEDRLRAWMQRKAGENGFSIPDDALVVGAPIDETFVRNGTRGKHVAIDFTGVLAVEERDRFRNAFAHGIGAAKSFGFGLLMLQPLN